MSWKNISAKVVKENKQGNELCEIILKPVVFSAKICDIWLNKRLTL
jgi:hypothetical protein